MRDFLIISLIAFALIIGGVLVGVQIAQAIVGLTTEIGR